MFHYILYNTFVSSDIKFDILPQVSSNLKPNFKQKVNISEDIFLQYNHENIEDIINIEEAYIHRNSIGIFKILKGRNIFYKKYKENIQDNQISRSLLNIIFGYCLYQQKKFVLHASAVSINRKAILFMGVSGSGKSTLSMSLKRHANFLTEDVACMEYYENSFQLSPGPPIVKLDDFSKKLLNINDNGHKLNSDRLNRKLYPVKNYNNENVKVSGCYFINWGQNFKINKTENEELLKYFLLCTYSAYPYNNCAHSSKLFHYYFQKFVGMNKVFFLERNKDDELNNNKKIIDHIYQNLI
jgi:hypothetical protein